MVLAERLLQTIQKCETQVDDLTLSVTASFGVTSFSPRNWKEPVKPEALLKQADLLLYEAKGAGRNQAKGRCLMP
jgi:diguanylate cyclase (GGDEF)-like protein